MTKPTPLTDQQLADITARHQAATPGPWYANHPVGVVTDSAGSPLAVFGGGDQDRADADFTAHAPEDVAALLAEVHHLRAELAAGRATVLGEVANELEGIDFHPNAKATCADLCRLLAGRFRRQGLAAIDAARTASAAGESHVVADGSSDPAHTDNHPGREPAAG